ncbi:MAG: Calx-beta domain-containing protein, partial [Acidimicrobiales bacterium]
TDASNAQRCATATKTWVVPILVSVNDVTVNEGDAGTTPATFTVSLSQPAPPAGVTVLASTANASATAPADYLAQTNTLVTVPSGQSSAPFTVAVVGDLVDEPDETFLVNLSSPTNANISDGQGVGTIVDDERDGAFSCRASALRVLATEPAVANGPNSPCADGATTSVPVNLPAGLVNVNSGTLNASTDQTPNTLEPTVPAETDTGVALASAERATVTALGLITIRATAISSQARVQCTAGPGGLTPTLTSSSTIASLTVNGIPANVLGNAVVNLPLGLGTIQLNRTVSTPTSLTRQAVRIVLLGQEIVIAEARANFSGNPCSQ